LQQAESEACRQTGPGAPSIPSPAAANLNALVGPCAGGTGADTIVFDLGPGNPEIGVGSTPMTEITEAGIVVQADSVTITWNYLGTDGYSVWNSVPATQS
jgi:hypothetical protein